MSPTMNLNCSDVRHLLSLFLDGELPRDDAAAVRAHLDGCPACRAIYEHYRADQRLLAQFSRTAPYLPVAEQVRAHIRVRARQRPAGRPDWSALAAGGHRVLGGVAVAALLTLVLVSALVLREMGRNGTVAPTFASRATTRVASPAQDTPVVDTSSVASAPVPSVDSANPLIAALGQVGLAFDVAASGQGVTVIFADGQVTFHRLAVDRAITLLEYTSSVRVDLLDRVALIDPRQGKMQPYVAGRSQPGSPPGNDGDNVPQWMAFQGVDLASTAITIQVRHQGTVRDIIVPVALDPLREFSAGHHDQVLSASDSGHGVKIDNVVLRSGVVVSTLEMRAAIVDRSKLVERIVDPMGTIGISVNLDTQPVDVPIAGVIGAGDAVTLLANVVRLQASGTLGVTIYWYPLEGSRVANGPWALEASLSGQPQQAVVVTPAATPRPVQESTRATTPMPSATSAPQPVPRLPADLYFLAESDGMKALWVQPADGSKARIVLKDKRDIVSYQVVPARDTIVYTLLGEFGGVYLAGLDGTERGQALMPNGQPVNEYVVAPGGRSIAYVPADARSVWVSDVDGRNLRQVYAAQDPTTRSLYQVEWSVNGKALLVLESADMLARRPVVVPTDADSRVLWRGSRDAIDVEFSFLGTNVLYSTYEGIWLVDLRDGRERDITPQAARSDRQQLFTNLTLLPDASLAFTLRRDLRQGQTAMQPAQLWTMNDDGSDPRFVRDDLGPVQDWAWIPNDSGYELVVALVDWQTMAGTTPTSLYYYRGLQAPAEPLASEAGSRTITRPRWGIPR